MKKLLITTIAFFTVATICAQKSIDVLAGRDLLSLLPDKLTDRDAKKEKDVVKAAKGFIGVTIHRDYGDSKKGFNIEIINLSPSLILVNNFLDNPVIRNKNQYLVTTIDGHRALIQTIVKESGKTDYELLIPITATLLVVRGSGYTRDELLALAQTIPVAAIAKKLQ